ncbi:MAG: amidohydrolase family protein [Clostridiales bacterium]|nr:amidohydrolase family protein [Clostridiales bacterium]
MIVLRNARLIHELTEGYIGQTADVAVENKTIQGIYPTGQKFTDCEEIDLQGKTLMPGMIDLHMHMYFSDDNFAALAAKTQNQQLISSIKYLRCYLENGFTTVRDCGNPGYIGVDLRDAIAEGIIEGPRVFTSGYCITPYAKGNDTFPGLYAEVNKPEDILGVCRKDFVHGVDFLKYMATGSVANVTGEPGELVTTREELFAMQRAADVLGTYVAVHCHGTSGIKLCVEAGIRTIEHASIMTDECIDLILKKGNKTALIPTLSPVVEIYEDAEHTTPDYLKAKISDIYEAAKMLVVAEERGVLLGYGTDSSMKSSQAHIGYEFYARSKVGFRPIDILKQATINGAHILGMQDEIGTIKAGKRADLIVIAGNPDENISAMYAKPAFVMKDGAIKRNMLDTFAG